MNEVTFKMEEVPDISWAEVLEYEGQVLALWARAYKQIGFSTASARPRLARIREVFWNKVARELDAATENKLAADRQWIKNVIPLWVHGAFLQSGDQAIIEAMAVLNTPDEATAGFYGRGVELTARRHKAQILIDGFLTHSQ